MAQGSRGRVALLGAGVLFCTGLVGCQDTKQYPPPPLAKGSTPSMNGMARTPGSVTGTGMTPGGSGAANTTWNNQNNLPASRTTPGAYDYNASTPNYGNTGTISGPAKTGVIGPGGPLPAGASSYVPPVGPSFPSDSRYGSSLTPGSPTGGYTADTTARGMSPTAAVPASIHSPEPPPMADPYPTPPPAPGAGGLAPAVTPSSGGPIAPPTPPAGSGPLPPQYQPIK